MFILYPAFEGENTLEPYVKESNSRVTMIISVCYFNKGERPFVGLMLIFEAVVRERCFHHLVVNNKQTAWDYYEKRDVASKVSRSIPPNYFFFRKYCEKRKEKISGMGGAPI